MRAEVKNRRASVIEHGFLMKNYKELDVWKRSIDFAVEVYRFTETFPSDEKFALASQLKRAAISISSNIAEGSARRSSKEYIRFLYISLGSAAEIETQLILAKKLGFGERHEAVMKNLQDIQCMLMGVIKYLRNHE